MLDGGVRVPGERLAARLARNDAHALVAVAVSAGREVADEATRLWGADRPDESYFLDRFATAVVESLLWRASAILCGQAMDADEWLVPHLSPGCGGWEIDAQRQLFELTGGVASIRDIEQLKAREGVPIAGCILGRSLYEGAIDPAQALTLAAC